VRFFIKPRTLTAGEVFSMYTSKQSTWRDTYALEQAKL
jgi:hypothetical protein